MPFQGFEGAAGTGKTHHLMEAVVAWVEQNPLEPHQQVLALTFMHGSRRRLDQRLSAITSLRGRYCCMTIDSLAEQLVDRWRSLCAYHNLIPGTFEETVNCAARLVEEPIVSKWVASTFPVVVVDEGQDLTPARLRLVQALPPHVTFFVAADEFQCLNDEIDPVPFRNWFNTGRITSLEQVRRTNQPGLLDAATALRAGRAPVAGQGINIHYKFKNQVPFSIGHELHRCLRAGGDVAVLVAPSAKRWADEMLPRFIAGMQTPKQNVTPLRIAWEKRADDEVEHLMAAVPEGDPLSSDAILAALSALQEAPPWLPSVLAAIHYQRRACGQVAWSKAKFKNLIDRRAALQRAYGFGSLNGIPIMTIHGAKNRQFAHVVVLWAPGVPGNTDHQRRLLYNAITRAQISCTVFVRTEPLLRVPPFA